MKRKGFTLVELLGVIVILTLVSLIAIPIVINITTLVKVSSQEVTASNIVKAYEQYYQLKQFPGVQAVTNLTAYASDDIKEILSLKGNVPDNFYTLKLEDNKVLLYYSTGDIVCWNYGSESATPDNTDFTIIEPVCKLKTELENSFFKQIRVKNGSLYDSESNTEFQIIGINFDNNTWNTAITAINTGHDETSYAELAAMGINTIRFGLAYNMTLQDNFFEWLDTNISQAEKAGLKIILDMHGSQGGIQLRDKEASYNFWQSEELQQQFIDTWVEIAEHYNQNNTVILYDLLNEPLVVIDENQNADDKYYTFMSKLVEAIRQVDSQTVICIEGYSSSILKYDEQIDETTYVANVTDSSSIIKKINDYNIVFDVHNYSPSEYTFQTEESPVTYSDLYSVKDRKSWGTGSDYYIIQTSTPNEWFLYETELFQVTDTTMNYGNIRYTFDKGNEGSTLLFDNLIVEEYDENMNFIQNVYDFSFNKSKYEWNVYGTQTYEIVSEGYDSIGGALKLTSIGPTGVLTLRIDNTGFNVTAGHYYKIKAYVKSSSVLEARNARLSFLVAKVGFAGGLKEISDYNLSKYQTFSNETKIPMICNEFGTNYNSIKNSSGDTYLYEVLSAVYKYKVNISLFSYSGFDFGLMYDSTRDFGTEKSNIRQESYDALYKALHQDNTYAHIFKNIAVMQEYDDLNVGDKVLVLGETLAGIGPKLEYIVTDNSSDNTIELSNELFALPQ